jgi:hypothetical protein
MEWSSGLLGLMYLHDEGCGGSAGCYAFPLDPASYKQCLSSSRVMFEMVPGGGGDMGRNVQGKCVGGGEAYAVMERV